MLSGYLAKCLDAFCLLAPLLWKTSKIVASILRYSAKVPSPSGKVTRPHDRQGNGPHQNGESISRLHLMKSHPYCREGNNFWASSQVRDDLRAPEKIITLEYAGNASQPSSARGVGQLVMGSFLRPPSKEEEEQQQQQQLL
eukprot:531697-Pelagomonas_calceolata.AAC.1